MPDNTIIFKLASAANVVPDASELEVGEPAFDQFTGKLWGKLDDETVLQLNAGSVPVTLADLGGSPLIHQHMPSDIIGLGISAIPGLPAALAGKQDAGNYAAAQHTHSSDDVEGLNTALSALVTAINGKQAAGAYAGEVHSHAISDVIGLQAALDAKAAVIHAHAISDVTGLQTALDGKAAVSHAHSVSDVTGLQTALDGKQAAGSYAAAVHTHAISDTTGLQTALDGKAASSHTHAISGVTGLQTALDGKQAAGSYAASVHSHVVADVTGLQAALDGKQASGSYAATVHTHAIGDTTGLQSALDGKAALSHTHTIANVTGLQTALDGKAPLSGVVPSGAVLPFAMSTAPSGWLECNGLAVSRTVYASLFAAIATTYGAGDGSTTFNLPDLRGEFIRGWDNGRGADTSGRVFGSAQTATGLGHIGTIGSVLAPSVADTDPSTTYAFNGTNGGSQGSSTSFTRHRFRPRNVAMLYCIKT